MLLPSRTPAPVEAEPASAAAPPTSMATPPAAANGTPSRATPPTPTAAEDLPAGGGAVLERALAALGLAVLAAPMALTALALRLDLGPPVLFRQRRAGLGGRPFTVAKFRTMTDARDAAGALLPDAQRTTPLSRLVRRLRLDELPQLAAVLGGAMALVGPRPLLPATVAGFGRLGRLRGRVRPGLTGWAQVNGNTRLSDAEKLALDLWYVERRSVRLDLAILALTVRTVLLGERVDRRRIDAARRELLRRHGAAAVAEAAAGAAAETATARAGPDAAVAATRHAGAEVAA